MSNTLVKNGPNSGPSVSLRWLASIAVSLALTFSFYLLDVSGSLSLSIVAEDRTYDKSWIYGSVALGVLVSVAFCATGRLVTVGAVSGGLLMSMYTFCAALEPAAANRILSHHRWRNGRFEACHNEVRDCRDRPTMAPIWSPRA